MYRKIISFGIPPNKERRIVAAASVVLIYKLCVQ